MQHTAGGAWPFNPPPQRAAAWQAPWLGRLAAKSSLSVIHLTMACTFARVLGLIAVYRAARLLLKQCKGIGGQAKGPAVHAAGFLPGAQSTSMATMMTVGSGS